MDEEKFINHCKSLNREDRLQFVLSQIKDCSCSDANIDLLDLLVNLEYRLDFEKEPPYSEYFNNVRQTKEKELAALLRVRDKPKKRQQYWKEAKEHFMTDISLELSGFGINT